MSKEFHLMKAIDREVLIKKDAPIKEAGKIVRVINGFIDEKDEIFIETDNGITINSKYVEEILKKKKR